MSKRYPTQCELMKYLEYNKDTGDFIWRVRSVRIPQDKTWNKRFSGTVAGNVNDSGNGKKYIDINLNILSLGKFRAHRLAWIYMHGDIDKDLEIDHIDGNGTNNSLDNLRLVKPSVNMKNQRFRESNSTGFTGVSLNSITGKYEAYITVNRKRLHLGHFSSLDSAAKVRKAAELTYGFHKNHGQDRPL